MFVVFWREIRFFVFREASNDVCHKTVLNLRDFGRSSLQLPDEKMLGESLLHS